MPTSNRRIAFLIPVLIALLAGCSQPVSPVQAPAPTTSPIPQSTIFLSPCKLGSADAQCGALKVYENRAARNGRMIDLRVAVIKASDPNPAPDPIFYLSGGPGGAATEDAAHGQQFPSQLSNTHDLVFVDQRGTGGSHRVVIPPTPDFTGLTLHEITTRMSVWAPKVIGEMDMEPRFYTTAIAMDDLDDVRAALGYDKINLFGHSYGATAAQYYLRQHEDHVRTVTLSGGTLLDVPVFEVWASNGQKALDKLFARCQADSACHAAYPDLSAEFTALLARLDAQPATDSFTNPSDGKPGTITYTRDFLAENLRVIMLDAQNAAHLPRLIHRASVQNDWTGITAFVLKYGPGDWGSQMMEHVIRCSEKWAAFSPAEVARLSAGSYLQGWYVNLANTHALACQFTPQGETPEGDSPQPGSQVPVLIQNGDTDPQGPPENMAGADKLWPNSLALADPYQGHWLSDFQEISCRWSIMTEFIQKASVKGVDTRCLAEIKPPVFDVRP
jgi:pimeloyl-ACP methyl ester carboxylesterase